MAGTFLKAGVGPDLQSLKAVEHLATRIDRFALVTHRALDLALSLRVARLTGVDMKAHLRGEATIRLVDRAPRPCAPGVAPS
ncbi:hypothetical protein [Paracoccus benzoatiresistens]|uniref:Uncharacterized protein n=1 Tax=Paracoccus benzoatiresistens TaxID=2997341 RepID=A0ABT4JBD0_9RHOB|nr:hypothetical protein [Paracoccus sp. EF6]MCZ0963995.1 hypothetical protein [Paracoccus sp. EF6]